MAYKSLFKNIYIYHVFYISLPKINLEIIFQLYWGLHNITKYIYQECTNTIYICVKYMQHFSYVTKHILIRWTNTSKYAKHNFSWGKHPSKYVHTKRQNKRLICKAAKQTDCIILLNKAQRLFQGWDGLKVKNPETIWVLVRTPIEISNLYFPLFVCSYITIKCAICFRAIIFQDLYTIMNKSSEKNGNN